ncbi:MAG TPA: amino acid permease [Candidatus Baltobacteraceae bacterium]|nr:amino acid permease [Candidatus Baltobacteraceae bacterium]
MAKLARRLGVFDAGLIVMGGIIGSGIFRNPSVVAQSVHAGWAIMSVWIAGGVVALLGAFVFAELAARRPHDGGLYAYMHDAYHPVVAFMYGFTLLVVSQSGGMAAAALTFAGYFEPLTGVHIAPQLLAFAVLAIFTIVNCLGVREGSNVQNFFMVLKIAAIAGLIGVGVFAHPAPAAAAAAPSAASTMGLFGAMAVSMIAVLFAYSGWQTSSFMTGELKNPTRTLPLGMIWGVAGVIALYVLVNFVCLRVLGPVGLMHTDAPASEVLRAFMGARGAQLIAALIAVSTLGFLSNQILTSPRVYHAMAEDGLFFKQIAWLHPKSRVPVIAIALQGAFAIAITFLKGYAQILNFVIGIDYVFFALSALAIFIFRARDQRDGREAPGFCIPLHPFTTALFLLITVAVVLTTYISSPIGAASSIGALLIAVLIYYVFLARGTRGLPEQASGNP